MADETPEQTRERVLAEELAKGSDPRVAEGRSKAAELRARQGLPIDPQEAWKAKLEKEGGAPAPAPAAEEPQAAAEEAPSEEAPAEAPAEAPEEAAAPPAEEAPEEEPAAAEAPQTTPAPSPVQAPVPTGVEVQRESTEIVPAAVSPPPAIVPSREIQFEPEIGEMVEFDTGEMAEVAGIKLADARLPGWLIAVFVALVGAAVIYLLAFSGPGAAEEASGCRVDANRAVVCGSTGTAPATSEDAAP